MSSAATPTRQQVKAVQAILYQPARLRTLNDHFSSITVLMNLDPAAQLAPKDIRVKAGSGPAWYLADQPGQLDSGVLRAASLCTEIAAIMQEIVRELKSAQIPEADRQSLQAALTQQAAVWTLRGQSWKDPNRPSNPAAIANKIGSHVRAAAVATAKVAAYYRPAAEVLKI